MTPRRSEVRTRRSTGRSAGVAAIAVVAAGALGTSAAAGATLHHLKSAHPRLSIERGAVIARDPGRQTLVVADRGVVQTLRFASARPVLAAHLGANVLARAVRLADGTYRVVGAAEHGQSHRVVVRATVVQAMAGRLLLAAGGSVFAVGAVGYASGARRAHAASSATTPGEVVDTTLQIGSSTVQSTAVQPVGQASMVDLQGVLQTIGTGSLVVAANAGADTTVTVPPSITLPSTIRQGDQVEITAAYSAGTFSLVTIVDDTLAATTTTQGVASPSDGSSEYVEIEGIVVAGGSAGIGTSCTGTTGTCTTAGTGMTGTTAGTGMTGTNPTTLTGTASTIVIQPGNGTPVTISVPSTMTLPPLPPGTRVHVVASMVSGQLTLIRLHVQVPEGGGGNTLGAGSSSQSCISGSGPANAGGRSSDHAAPNDQGAAPGSGTCGTAGTGTGTGTTGTSAGTTGTGTTGTGTTGTGTTGTGTGTTGTGTGTTGTGTGTTGTGTGTTGTGTGTTGTGTSTGTTGTGTGGDN